MYAAGALNDRHVHGGRSFLALLDVKGDPVALIKGFETACIDP